MSKVRCKFCVNEEEGFCVKKKVSVKINKKRACNLYADDQDKMMDFLVKRSKSKKPQAIMRPDWYWDDSKTRRAKIAEEIASQYETTAGSVDDVPIPKTGNQQHPMTGDLSRFVEFGDGQE